MKVAHFPMLALAWVCLGRGAPAQVPYCDAVQDLGCQLDDPDAAADNAQRLNEWFDSLREPYAAPSDRRRLTKLVIPAGRLYVSSELVVPSKTSIAIEGATSGVSYPIGEWNVDRNAPGGPQAQIIRLRTPHDRPDDGSAVFRLCGHGTRLANLGIYGRRLPKNFDSGEGTRTQYGVLVEGREAAGADAWTGGHDFQNLSFVDCATPFYFPRNQLVEAHADTCVYGHINAYGFTTFWHCDNQQSIGHTFYSDVTLGDGGDADPKVAFRCDRGGHLIVVNVQLNCKRITLLKLRDYSPNTNRFELGFRWDTPNPPPGALTLLDLSEAEDYPFAVRLSGLLAARPAEYEPKDLFKFAEMATQQPDDLRVDVTNLPQALARRWR